MLEHPLQFNITQSELAPRVSDYFNTLLAQRDAILASYNLTPETAEKFCDLHSSDEDRETILTLYEKIVYVIEHKQIPPSEIMLPVIDLAGDCMPDSWKKEGWSIESHVGEGELELDVSKIQFYVSLNQKDDNGIRGNDLWQELEVNKVPVLNGCVLDYLIAHPEIIPEAWKGDKNININYIFFWGTVYRNSDGGLFVRYLHWNDGVWGWHCRLLGRDWFDQDPAAMLAHIT